MSVAPLFTAIQFCPPPPPMKTSLLGSTTTTIPPLPTPSSKGASHALVGSFPVTTVLPPPPHLSSQPQTQQPYQPPPAPKRKRVVKADGQTTKKQKLAIQSARRVLSPSPTVHTPSSRTLSPATTVRPTDEDDDDDDFGFERTPSFRRSGSLAVKTGSQPFGKHEHHTVIKRQMKDGVWELLPLESGSPCAVQCISSESVVMELAKKRQYKAFFSNPHDPQDRSFDPENLPAVTLEYPNHGASERYILLAPSDKDHYNPIMELVNTIHTIIKCYFLPPHQIRFGPKEVILSLYKNGDELEQTKANDIWTQLQHLLPRTQPEADTCLIRKLEKAINRHDGPLFMETVKQISAVFLELKDIMMKGVKGWLGIPPPVYKAIVEECYQRCVGPSVKDLGKYAPFSDQVYGELNASFVSDIMVRTGMQPGKIFVDLGCGVGNCLIQAAAQTQCNAFGIEINAPPAELGKKQIEEFGKRLKMWGLSAGEATFVQGDFCEERAVEEWLKVADVVLVNNWAFSASLNEKLSLMFLDLKEGAQIISLKPYRAADFRITERTMSSPAAILDMEAVRFHGGAVSWMGEGGWFYLHKKDRAPLAQFEEQQLQQIRSMSTSTRGSGSGSARKRRTNLEILFP